MPSGVAVASSPATGQTVLAASNSNPGGSGHVSTTAASMAPPGRHILPPSVRFGRPVANRVLWLVVLGLLGMLGLANARRSRQLWIALAVASLSVLLWTSCGGGGGGCTTCPPNNPGTSAGPYTITVTATSGSLMSSTTLNLTVN